MRDWVLAACVVFGPSLLLAALLLMLSMRVRRRDRLRNEDAWRGDEDA